MRSPPRTPVSMLEGERGGEGAKRALSSTACISSTHPRCQSTPPPRCQSSTHSLTLFCQSTPASLRLPVNATPSPAPRSQLLVAQCAAIAQPCSVRPQAPGRAAGWGGGARWMARVMAHVRWLVLSSGPGCLPAPFLCPLCRTKGATRSGAWGLGPGTWGQVLHEGKRRGMAFNSSVVMCAQLAHARTGGSAPPPLLPHPPTLPAPPRHVLAHGQACGGRHCPILGRHAQPPPAPSPHEPADQPGAARGGEGVASVKRGAPNR